jgi:N-acetylmuramoyl-L-alanine amidase
VARLLAALLAGAAALTACGTARDDRPRRAGDAAGASAVALPHATPKPAADMHAAGGTASNPRHVVPWPKIVWKPIPYDKRRKREMADYAQRHYGFHDYRLRHPHVIVEHYTDNESFSATYNTFAPDNPDPELHELPNVCAQFVVDRDGTIYQLVSVKIMCRHTVGLNYTAIGIEHVGTSESEILSNERQIRASLKLTRWLRCTKDIRVSDVIGHNESLGSRYHKERVASLRTQTHSDWTHHYMRTYRDKLRKLAGC